MGVHVSPGVHRDTPGGTCENIITSIMQCLVSNARGV